jgi:FkbM family methyltransferase
VNSDQDAKVDERFRVKAYLKSKLRPYIGKRLRAVMLRVRGIENERPTHEMFAALVGKKNPTILEIGCNDGTDTLALLRLMPFARIYCFEPDPRAVKRFKERLGSELEKVMLFEAAISDRTERISFFPSTGNDIAGDFNQAGSIRRPKNVILEDPWVRFKDAIEINSYRLDDWCAENSVQQIDLIWMDVQGAEGDVITGAQETLRRVRYIYTEYSNNELYEGQLTLRQLRSRLSTFEIIRRYPGDVLFKNKEIHPT